MAGVCAGLLPHCEEAGGHHGVRASGHGLLESTFVAGNEACQPVRAICCWLIAGASFTDV